MGPDRRNRRRFWPVVAVMLVAVLNVHSALGQSSTRARGEFQKAIPVAPPDPPSQAPRPQSPPAGRAVENPSGPPVIIWDPAASERASGRRRGAPQSTSQPAAQSNGQSAAQPATQPPVDGVAASLAAAEAFYRSYAQIRPSGVPSAAQRQRLRAHLSPALDASIAAAARAEQENQRQSGGGAPPLHEGDIFTSLPEGATSFSVRDCRPEGDRVVCIGHLVGAQGEQWQDRLVMVRTASGWRLDDVIYGGRFGLGNSVQLTVLLAIIVRQMNPTRPPPGAEPPVPSEPAASSPEVSTPAAGDAAATEAATPTEAKP